MKRIIASVLISSLLISGCSYDISKGEYEKNQQFYERVNKVCKDKDELIIRIKDGKSFKGKEIKVASDTTTFVNLESNFVERITTNKITEIEFSGTGTSIFEGFLFGSLAGGGSATLFFPESGSEKGGRAIGILLGIAIGGLIGVIYSILSHPHTVVIL